MTIVGASGAKVDKTKLFNSQLIYSMAFAGSFPHIRGQQNGRGGTKMVRKRTKSERLRDSMSEREVRFQRVNEVGEPV